MSDDQPSFNLIDEPWIQVLRRDGTVSELGIRAVFREAPTLSQLVGDIPTQSFAILRLLLAVAHRAIDGPKSVDEWGELQEDWSLLTEAADRYLQAHRDRFFLFHPVSPFFQVAGLATRKSEIAPLEKLVADVPNGEPFFTTRLRGGLASIPLGEAARWLVHCQAYDAAGLRPGANGTTRRLNPNGTTPPEGTGWAGQIGGVVLEGTDLAETLLLNLPVFGGIQIESSSRDLPPWERPPLGPDPRETDQGGATPQGPVDLYTWQARRVRLVGDDSAVTGIVLCAGDRAVGQNRHVVEPMTAWRFSKEQTKKAGAVTYMPRAHESERVFWRGLSSLLPHVATDDSGGEPAAALPPGVLRWISVLQGAGLIDQDRHIAVHSNGMQYGSNSSVIEELVDDRLTMTTALLSGARPELVLLALEQVTASDTAVRALANLVRNIARASGAGGDESAGPANRARELAYAALDQPFRAWLSTLGDGTEVEEARQTWQQQARSIIWALSRDRADQAGPSAWVGRHVDGRQVDLGVADVWFRHALSKALPFGWIREEVGNEEVA